MSSRAVTAGVALGALLLALCGGTYLSGWITLKLLGLQAPLTPMLYPQYVQAVGLPEYIPYAAKIKVAGMVGFGLPLLVWLGTLFLLFRRPKSSLHGEARFANAADLRREGLLKDDHTGLIIGKSGSRFLRLPGTRHALLAAPTRSGKGVGFVMPNLLNFRGSVVVLDIKQEAFDMTAGWRSQLGPVFLFNPFADDLRTHAWNPLSYVRADLTHRTADLQAIADTLYKEAPGQDPFWTNMGRSTFVAVASYLFDVHAQHVERHGTKVAEPHHPTLGDIYRLLSGGEGNLREFLQSLMERPYVQASTRLGLANVAGLAEETFTSVIAMTQSPLLIMANPIVDAATSRNDFWLHDLRRQVFTIYVGIAPSKLSEASGLLNLFFEQAIKANGSVLPEQDPELKHQCLFLLDEFTALGKVNIIVNAVGWLAGYNVRIACVIQSLSQLESVYGAEAARGMVTNLACQIIYTPREQRDAEEYSKILGDTTVRRRQRSHGQGGKSYTELEERRPLMLPQELKAMSPEQQIVVVEGSAHPIKCRKIRYYKDRTFKSRMRLAKADVPVLSLDRSRPEQATESPQQQRQLAEPTSTVPLVAQDPQGQPSSVAMTTPASPSTRATSVPPVTIGKVPFAMELQADSVINPRPPTPQSSPMTVGKPDLPDRLQDLNLQRMMKLANQRTSRELGPLPADGLPVAAKQPAPHLRRPLLQAPAAVEPLDDLEESEKVNLKETTAAALMVGSLLGCEQSQREPEAYLHNPNPTEKYEMTVTVENAPGPFESVGASAGYKAPDCQYVVDKFNGIFRNPYDSKGIDLKKTSENEWKGYFYADEMVDKDYGFGMCKWVLHSAGPAFRATHSREDTSFSLDMDREQLLSGETVTKFYPKRRYPSTEVVYPAYGHDRSYYKSSITDAELFTITVSVEKVAP